MQPLSKIPIGKYFFKEFDFLRERHEFVKSKEEKYNIFSVLYKEHDERKLHSRFIASLLDPFGSHEKHNVFLLELLNPLLSKDAANTFENSMVYPTESDKREYRNIDILIINKSRSSAVIIENKIYAGDSNNEESGQLERYFEYVRDVEFIPSKNIFTFYLTLDGHEPSTESLGKYKELQNINGKCISYPEIIVPWLDRCITYTANKPFLRENILQYQSLLKKMTHNDIDRNERIEIRDRIGSDKSAMNATKYLLDNFKHVKWHTVADFWKELENHLTTKGFTVTETPTAQNITDITHYEIYRKGQREKQSCGLRANLNGKISFWIRNYSDDWLYWGVDDNENLRAEDRILLQDYQEKGIMRYHEGKYWWRYCFQDEDQKRIMLADFSIDGTFQLINREYREAVASEIADEVYKALSMSIKIM